MFDCLNPLYISEEALAFHFSKSRSNILTQQYKEMLDCMPTELSSLEAFRAPPCMAEGDQFKRLHDGLVEFSRNLLIYDENFEILHSIYSNSNDPEKIILLLYFDSEFYIIHKKNFVDILKTSSHSDPETNQILNLFSNFNLSVNLEFEIFMENFYSHASKQEILNQFKNIRSEFGVTFSNVNNNLINDFEEYIGHFLFSCYIFNYVFKKICVFTEIC